MATYNIKQSPGLFVLSGLELDNLSKSIKDIEKEFRVREVDITFKEERLLKNTIRSSDDAYKFIKEVIYEGIEIQEHFIVLYLNQGNRIIGYYRHSKGTINSTQVDVEILVAVGLKILCKAVILSHNHPSGNTDPSEPDRQITKKIKQGFSLFDVSVLDHVIVTKNAYYSFADHGEAALSGIGKTTAKNDDTLEQVRSEILQQLRKVTKANSPYVWEMIQTKKGYLDIEYEIIRRMVSQQLVPAAIIPQMESED